jgi:hypothetical protein
MTQAAILPGDLHWIVRLAHLLVGLVAMGLGERLAVSAKARLQGAGAHQPARVAPELGAPA